MKNNRRKTLPFDDRQASRHRQAFQPGQAPRPGLPSPWLLPVLVLLLAGLITAVVFTFKRSDTPNTSTTPTTGSEPQETSNPSPSAAPTATSESDETEPVQTQTQATTAPPLLDPQARASALEATGQEVLARINQEPACRVAVTFINLAAGESWSHQEELPFVAASSIKVGFNACLYERMARQEIDPLEELAYDSRPYPTGDYEPGTGSIQGMPNGSRFSIRETSSLSIRISDNCATNMILRRLGGIDAVNPWLNDISGIVDYRQPVSYLTYAGQTAQGRHRTCSRDLAEQMAHLYRAWLAEPAVYDPLLDDLKQTEFSFGLHRGVPEGVAVAHKIGTNGAYATENDVGIVFTTEPFVLCVMTEMADAGRAHQLQADITALFYDCVKDWPLAQN